MKNLSTLVLSSLTLCALAGVAEAAPTIPAEVIMVSGTPCTVADIFAKFPESMKPAANGCGLCHSAEGSMMRKTWLDGSAWELSAMVGGKPAPGPMTKAIWDELAANKTVDFDMDGVSDAAEIAAGFNPRMKYDAANKDASKLCAGADAWPGDMAGAGGAGGMANGGAGGMGAGGAGGMATGGTGGMVTGTGGMVTGTGGMVTGTGGMVTGTGGMVTGTGGAATGGAPATGGAATGGAGGMVVVAPPAEDDGGCAVSQPRSVNTGWAALLLLGLPLVLRRRRSV
ncbi:MAG: hypothetical protein RJA70_2051 [Pseudomonadota bacterium]|jgi:MYXO-CTERM domain-containing protein